MILSKFMFIKGIICQYSFLMNEESYSYLFIYLSESFLSPKYESLRAIHNRTA